MIHFELRVSGQTAVQNALRTAAATGRKRMVNVTYQWAEQNVMAQFRRAYPPPRPGQTYRRTGNLGRGWAIRINQGSVTIHNAMPYAGYVVGDAKGAGQAWMHRGRWWVARDAIDEARPLLKAMVIDELNHMFALGMVRS